MKIENKMKQPQSQKKGKSQTTTALKKQKIAIGNLIL